MSEAKSFKEEWKILKSIGAGGQGTPLLVKSLDEKNTAVVKILNRQGAEDRRARMHREASILSTLEHPNITKFLDSNTHHFKDHSYNFFIVTEFIDGPTLSELDYEQIPLDQKIILFKAILQALDFCHQMGIVHRDIKPDNIILRNGNLHHPVILDFGLSFNNNEKDDDNLTPEGEQLGNRFLLLPEQKSGEASKRNDRSDIASTVGLFFYFITGIIPTVLIDEHNRKPHQRETAKELLDKIAEHQRKIINNIFDTGFDQLIDRRWQTAKSLIDQLEYLEKSKPIEMSEEKNLLASIKEKVKANHYQEIIEVKELYKQVDVQVRGVIAGIIKELGGDWGSVQSGGPSTDGQLIYRNRLAPHNATLGFSGETIIFAFITGSEIVIQILEGDLKIEIFRHPVLGLTDWTQFRETLRIHYLAEIEKKL